ncbi:MAG: alpha/beta hydrolase [Roseobacter sp.]|jgi:acetyl esterase/lipase
MNLDDAFAQAVHIPQGETYPPRWTREAADFRHEMGTRAELAVSYGPGPRQVYDLFHCEGEAAGTLVFVHGGYWLRNDRTLWSHLARGALARGWNVAVVQYDLCPDVSIAEVTGQIACAVTQIAERSNGPLSLTGHSAGGQLVARMLAPGVLKNDILQRVARVAPIAPVADLRPLLQTSMNEHFRMDMAAAEAESPVLQPAPETAVRIWVGAEERPALLEQADALADAWEVPLIVVPDRHHFDIIDALCDPQSDMIRFLTLQ